MKKDAGLTPYPEHLDVILELTKSGTDGVHSQFLTELEFKKTYAPFLIKSALGDSKNTRNFKLQATFFHFSGCCQKMRMLPTDVLWPMAVSIKTNNKPFTNRHLKRNLPLKSTLYPVLCLSFMTG